jgi:hypothetical protein
MPPPHDSPEPTSRVPWILAVVALLLAFSFPYLERLLNANERPRLLQGIAWMEGDGAAIDGPSARGIPPGIDVARSVDGRLVPNKPPGATVPAAVAYGILRATTVGREQAPTLREHTWLARILGGWLPTVVLITLAWRRYRSVLGPSIAAAAVSLYALATPANAYAHLLFGHQLAALFVWLGLVALVDAGITRPRDPLDRRRALAAAVGGGAFAAAVAVEYQTAFVALPAALLMLVGMRSPAGRRRALAATAGAVPIMTLLAAYHHAVFGSVLSTGYHHVVDESFAATHAVGLLGLHRPSMHSLHEHLVSPWGGLLYWAPILVLAALGCGPLLRRLEPGPRREAALMLASFVALLLVNVSLVQTGGWRVGPRYLVAAFPLLILPLGVCLREHGRRPVLAASWVTLIAWSATINMLAANLFPHLIPNGNPVGDLLVPLWRAGLEPWSVVHLLGFDRGGSWLVALGTAAVCSVVVRAFTADGRRSGRAIVAGLGLASLCLLATVLSSPSSPSAEVDLATIVEAWEPDPGYVRRAHTP